MSEQYSEIEGRIHKQAEAIAAKETGYAFDFAREMEPEQAATAERYHEAVKRHADRLMGEYLEQHPEFSDRTSPVRPALTSDAILGVD